MTDILPPPDVDVIPDGDDEAPGVGVEEELIRNGVNPDPAVANGWELEGLVLGSVGVSDELSSDGMEELGPVGDSDELPSDGMEELGPADPEGVDDGGAPHIHVHPGVVVGVGSSVGDDCMDPDVDDPAGVVDDRDKVVDDNRIGLYPVLPVVPVVDGAGVVDDVNKYGMNPGDGDPVVVAGDVEDGIL